MSAEKVYVVGVGPGAEDYLMPLARRRIEEADILVGSARLIGLFPGKESRDLDLRGDPPGTIRFILESRRGKKLAVLVSGDPGLYSFLGVLARYLRPEEYEVIPGISSVQLAFARLGESWENAFIRSVHGRGLEGLIEAVKEHSKVALLTDGHLSPRDIATYLLEGGVSDRELVVCRNLSYPDESITRTDLQGASSLAAAEGLYTIIIEEKRAC
ncbi:MAG: precorrin-6y C5,15-methyltransferase (decarboxylating) subunit CbiE [Dehalococcoidia bacterium]